MRALGKLGLLLFLMFSGLIVFIYVVVLYDKIAHPGFKNLNNREFEWVSLIVFALVLIDIIILWRFTKGTRKSNDRQ